MLWLWVALCLTWQGANSFMIHSALEGLCLEDSGIDAGVQLRRCSLDSQLQQWVWTETWFLMNVGTQKCLSALRDDPVRTVECDGEDHLKWQCVNRRLISVSRPLELTADRGELTLTNSGKNYMWKSLDEGGICQDRLRSRRQSEGNELTEDERDQMGTPMTPEQREYLRWFYRSEDPTPWILAMLTLSFVSLLLGSSFLVMGMMGSRNRKKIAQYKAAAAASPSSKLEMEELQVITHTKDDMNSHIAPKQDNHTDNTEPTGVDSEMEAPKPGEVIVTWKDGNVSHLYSDSPEDGEEEKINE
ncbi:solute carrier family 51 subunit beta [Pygocentrus nattereri]|uniref:solute carrier family 51 subunit beta n=1 Tax=Pygocentrus nattereri TaxID=42514 RepID=UPI000814B108|nr:solute carrier family 51 subunit beta [Pygocentrus nattereri]